MARIKTDANVALRDHNTANVPGSGAHRPVLSELRALFAVIDGVLASLGVNGAITVKKATKALLDADLAHAADTLAIVYDDSTAANNGIYAKSGGSGSGSWAITDVALPSSFATDLAAVEEVLTQTIRKKAETEAALQGDLAHEAGTLALVYADATETKNGIWIKVGGVGLGGWEATSLLRNVSSPVVVRKDTFADLEGDLAWPADSLAWVTNDPKGWKNGVYIKIGGSGSGGWEGVHALTDGFTASSMIYYVDPENAPGSIGVGVSLRQCEGAAPGEAVGNFAGGHRSGEFLSNGWGHTLLGFHTGRLMTDKDTVNAFAGVLGNVGCTIVGYNSAQQADGILDCCFFGANAGLLAEAPMDSVVIGINAGYNMADASEVLFAGHGAGQYIIGRGTRANIDETTTDTGDPLYSWGHRLTFVGDQAGRFTNEGDAASTQLQYAKFSTFLGAQTTSLGQYQRNETVIGYKGRGRGTNTTVIGGDDNTDVWTTGRLRPTGPLVLPSYTVGTVPSASATGAGGEIYVSNETGGAVIAFSDGSNWRRVTDRAVIA